MSVFPNLDSDVQSSNTAPDVQLDYDSQIQDIQVLQNVQYITQKCKYTPQQLVDQITQDPFDTNVYQELNKYLYNRYKATHDELISKTKHNILLQQSQDLAKSQILDNQKQCQRCKQLQQTIEKMQLQQQPCMNCSVMQSQVRQLLTQVQLAKSEINTQQLSQDLQSVLQYNYKPQAFKTLVKSEEIQQLKETMRQLNETAQTYLINQQLKPVSTIPEQLCEETHIEVVEALNRATLKLKEKDDLISQMRQVVQQSQLQIQQMSTVQTNNLQSKVNDSNQLFYELINQEIYNQQTPSDEKEFLTHKFAKQVTVRKSIADLMRETLHLLSDTFGRNDLLIEQNLQPPVSYIKEQLDENQVKMFEEVQRIGSLCLSVRYCTQSCLSAVDEQLAELNAFKQKKNNQVEDMKKNQQLQKSLGLITKSLFNMTLWPEQQFLKKAFGTLSSSELMKLLGKDTGLPNGFFDENIVKDLNDLVLTPGDPVEQYEKLAQILQEVQFKQRVVPTVCADLAKIAIELEETVKEQTKKLAEKDNLIADLKEIIKQENAKKQDLLSQLQNKDLQLNEQNTAMTALKNEQTTLKVQVERIPGLETMIKTLTAENEKFSFENAQQKQSIENQKVEIQAQQKQISDQIQKILGLEATVKQQVMIINQMEIQAKDLVQSRTDVLNKNKELVALCRGMEQRVKDQENEIIQCKRLIGQEMPLLQEQIQNLKVLNEHLKNEAMDAQNEKRKQIEQFKDLTLLREKLEQQVTQLKIDNKEYFENFTKFKNENKDLNEEVDRLSQLYVQEQQKSLILGQNLDQIAERNIEMEQTNTKVIAEHEHYKQEFNQQNQLLLEANAQLSVYQTNMNELKSKLNATVDDFGKTQIMQATHVAENQLLRQTVENLNKQLMESKTTFQTELNAKQHLINEITTQLGHLTVNLNGTEAQTVHTIRAQVSNETNLLLNNQQQDFQQQLAKLDQDNTLLIQELTNTKNELKQKQKDLKQLQSDNTLYKTQITQITEIQEKLAEKSRKLLKTTNALKTKCLTLLKCIERIGTYSQGLVTFEAMGRNQQQYNTVLSQLTLADVQPEQEIHAADILKAPSPTEAQMKDICDLITKGVNFETARINLQDKDKEVEYQQQLVQQKQNEIRELEKRNGELYLQNKEIQQKTAQMEQTITLLTQNLQVTRQLKQEKSAQKLMEEIKDQQQLEHKSQDLSIDEIKLTQINRSTIPKPPPKQQQKQPEIQQPKPKQMKSSNLTETKKETNMSDLNDSFSHLKLNQPFSDQGPSRYGKTDSSYVPLSFEEQQTIQRLLRQNQVVQDQPVPVGINVQRK
ncbi:Conserved_hypothetical protein [Hexamita inflata]|uniref:Uncharacterized protein n=1 Tax=Hexamita inflata TaxID=28002 RepID=A0ABP1HPF5_9EUKA